MKTLTLFAIIAGTLALSACAGTFVRPDLSEDSTAERVMNRR